MEPPKEDGPAGVARLLKEGWQRPTLTFFDDMPKDEIAELLPGIVNGWTDEDYKMLKREAKRQKRRLDLDDNLFLQHQALLFRDRSFIDRKLEDTPLGQARMGAEMEVVRGALPRVGWRSGMHRRAHQCTTEDQRARLEEKEREARIQELVKLLEVTEMIEVENPLGKASKYMAARYAMGRRANTIRQHVKVGIRLREYMNKIYNVPWLRYAGYLIGYISLRMEEPCGKSVPSSLFKALVFLETSAEVPPDRRISGSMALQHFLMEIERSDVWQPKSKTKAARWTVEMVLALEHIIMDKDKEKFKRVMAWYKLIKLWGALRSHDTEAIPPSTIKYEESHGLEAQIMRTKTTGSGRKVEVVTCSFHLKLGSLTEAGWWRACASTRAWTTTKGSQQGTSSCVCPRRTFRPFGGR